MLKKDYIILTVTIFTVLLIDQLTKRWALGLEDIINYGILNFFVTYNKVAFLGILTDLPQDLKSVGFATVAAVFIIFYGFIQIILPERLFGLRLGLTFLLGGVLSNLVDRLVRDCVIDFIILGSKENIYYVFNVADCFEIAAYALIFYAMIKNIEVLWPKDNKRKKKWVNPAFQFRFILLNFALISSISLALFVFSYTFFKATLDTYLSHNVELSEHIFDLFLRLYLLINFVLFFCYFAISLIVSHRIAGPIYAFKKYITELLNHPRTEEFTRKLVLRKYDEFEELVLLSEEIKENILKTEKPSH